MRHVLLNHVSRHYNAQQTETKCPQRFRPSLSRSGHPEKQVLEEIRRSLCLGLRPSTFHQALQQLQTFGVPDKTSFVYYLSEIPKAVTNAKDLALVPLNDSAIQFTVKASIDA